MTMQNPTGLTVDVVRAEPARFRHPLLLLHGLWTGNWIWREFAGHLANRGWESWLPSMLRDGIAPSPERRLHELQDLCRSMPAPPVIVTHDAALATGVMLARAVTASAVVAIAPWIVPPGGRLALARDPHFWTAALFAARVAPPPVPHPRLAGIEPDAALLEPDSGPYFRSLFAEVAADEGTPPGLIVAGSADPATPVHAAKRVAARLGWSCDVHETAGHFPMVRRGSDRLADRVHRWIVQTTGRAMLLWDEDEDDEE